VKYTNLILKRLYAPLFPGFNNLTPFPGIMPLCSREKGWGEVNPRGMDWVRGLFVKKP